MPNPPESAASRLEAALVVLSETLSSAELRQLIGADPDRSWERGDPIGRSGRAHQKYSGWSIRVGPSEEPAESHLASLLRRVRGLQANLARAAADARVNDISIWIWSQGRTFGLDLTSSRVREIADLGASLKIDVYDGARHTDPESQGNGHGSWVDS